MDIFFLLCTTSICGRGCSILFSSRSGRLFQFSITYELTLSLTKCLDLVLSIKCKHQCSVTVDIFSFPRISLITPTPQCIPSVLGPLQPSMHWYPSALTICKNCRRMAIRRIPPNIPCPVVNSSLNFNCPTGLLASNLTIPRQRFDR
jgi:hypothetical protein